MNFNLLQIPERNLKPRDHGITMVMDKGLSITEVHHFMSVASPHVDIVKLGFGTSFVTPNLRAKIEAYKSYNIPVYFGGTLFEAFLIRNQFDDYISVCKDYGIDYIEVSDGSIDIPHAEKCGYSWEALIRCLYIGEYYDEAVEQVDAAIRHTDNKPIFTFYLSAIYFAMGRSKEGLVQLENGMNKAPRLLKKLIDLNPSILQHQQVVDLVARYKKNRAI